MSDQDLRHLVFQNLHSLLPPASIGQADTFVANLRLTRFATPARVDSVLLRLVVSPDIGETVNYGLDLFEIERQLEKKFGDRLAAVPGFYRHAESGRMKLNLPKRCALYGYRSRINYFAGFLCQPLQFEDRYFLLSSAKFGGPKAVRLEYSDKHFFEQYTEPDAAPTNAAQLRQNVAI